MPGAAQLLKWALPMDLKTYEQLKFELAELIREGQLLSSKNNGDPRSRANSEQSWRGLLARLAEDRFTVVVAGRFNRGKSSLMNALLGSERLPTGVVPLTSVITYVRYGTSERVLLDYYGSGLRGEANLEELPEFVTEKGNPGNVKRIRAAEIQLPAEILRRGFFLVDTPGLGSAIFENSQTTQRFIPEIDVLILVTSYESPLTDDEIRFLQQASASVQAIFLVINKQDTVRREERSEVIEYVSRAARAALNDRVHEPFSISAREGLLAKQRNDPEALQSSGILEFENDLVHFLVAKRAQLFLASMLERVSAACRSLPAADAEKLRNRLSEFQPHVGHSEKPTSTVAAETPQLHVDLRFGTPCAVCREVMRRVIDFLRHYQYDLSTRPETQETHARRGGFCPLHTWHYEQTASPRGICTAYPKLLNRVAEDLRLAAADASSESRIAQRFPGQDCPACRVRWDAEDEAVSRIVADMGKNGAPGRPQVLCLPHLELLLTKLAPGLARRQLLIEQAEAMGRVAEDMQRYAIKHDALRRDLASKEENDSALVGLQLLTGHRNVNAIFTIRNIL